MKEISMTLLLMFALCEIASDQGTQNRSAVKCAEDSPERRGEEGCTILASRPLSGAITGAIYWHIDRFNSPEDAKKAAGPNGVAAEAWIAQAGESTAWAPFIRKSPLPGQVAKAVIVQFARGDKTNQNPSTTAIIRAGDLADRATLFRNDLAFLSNPAFSRNHHTFLTNLVVGTPAAVAVGAQSQIAVFFASNGALTIDPDGPGPLFEVPIAGPLQEDLAFIP